MLFFKKQKPKEEVKICNHKVCYKCGHLFETGGKEVEVRGFKSGTITFCENCKPNYDYIERKIISSYKDGFIQIELCYFRHQPDIEVNEKGEPIKKK